MHGVQPTSTRYTRPKNPDKTEEKSHKEDLKKECREREEWIMIPMVIDRYHERRLVLEFVEDDPNYTWQWVIRKQNGMAATPTGCMANQVVKHRSIRAN